MTPPAIQTEGLTKYYGRARGIEDVDLVVQAGEVFGFLGPNGAGKTTTIRVLFDLIRPTRGQARLLGLDSRRESLEIRRRSSYLPGELKLPERPTGLRFLTYLASLRGRGADQIEPLAARVGLDLTRPLGDLSKGNRQKVGVVAAFMHDPEVLILDEPTSGLDPLRQQDVLELIGERARAGRTVFLSSHELDQVQRVAHRVGIIRDGRMIAIEEMARLRERALRRVEVRFRNGGPTLDALTRIDGVRDVKETGGLVRLHVEGSMDALVKELARHDVQTLTSEEPELDEIFLAFYGRVDGN